jgi:hypothetical protein
MKNKKFVIDSIIDLGDVNIETKGGGEGPLFDEITLSYYTEKILD